MIYSMIYPEPRAIGASLRTRAYAFGLQCESDAGLCAQSFVFDDRFFAAASQFDPNINELEIFGFVRSRADMDTELEAAVTANRNEPRGHTCSTAEVTCALTPAAPLS
jgi:hypothetical protein